MKKRTTEAPPQEPASDTLETAPRALAYVEVGSSEMTRDINRDLVLELIRVTQPISRVDLARASGLQPSTVSSIVERLLEERWIRESAMIKTARGRRPTLLSLNDEMVFLVADIRLSHAVVAVVDLNGRFLERQAVPMSRSPEASVERMAQVMAAFHRQHASKNFQGVGVSLPGRVDSETNELVLAPGLPWSGFPLHERLCALLAREGLGSLDVQMENAANATLLAELWFGQVDGIRNSMLLTVTDVIAAAILADGRLIGGQQGLAGEFGHIAIDPEGPVCRCGARGCWEMYASSRAAMRYYAELEPKAPNRSLLELLSLAQDGDTSANAALSRQARAIGQGLHLLNAVFSPEVILLAGDLAAFFDLYRDLIAEECREGAMDGIGPRLVSVGDGDVTRLRGAAAVALQRHAGYYRTGRVRGENRSVRAAE